MSLRQDFVQRAQAEGANVRALCGEFGISRKTGYKWLAVFRHRGMAGLADRSRRPHSSPGRTCEQLEAAVLTVRSEHPAWGGRKIRHQLGTQPEWDHLRTDSSAIPVASTITAILRRNGRLDPEECAKHAPYQSFEHAHPNSLWQMDFKGDFALASGARCHPLTVLDDHSRFNVALQACANERTQTVRERLTACFREYGLPERMLMDNGPPWGGGDVMNHTELGVWLMRLGIHVCHGRPWHPQTQGKDERFHRTLMDELVRPVLGLSVRWNAHASTAAKPGAALSQSGKRVNVEDHAVCQEHFDRFRQMYNHQRPHEAIGMQTPATRYEPSSRPFPEALAPIEYPPETGQEVRKVQSSGVLRFAGHVWHVGTAFRGLPVAIRPSQTGDTFDIYFCHQRIGHIDLHKTEAHPMRK